MRRVEMNDRRGLATLLLLAACNDVKTFPPTKDIDPSISELVDDRGDCQWDRVDPVSKQRQPVLRFSGPCEVAEVAWEEGTSRVLVTRQRMEVARPLLVVDLDASRVKKIVNPIESDPVVFRAGFDDGGAITAIAFENASRDAAEVVVDLLHGQLTLGREYSSARYLRLDGTRWAEADSKAVDFSETEWSRHVANDRSDHVDATVEDTRRLRRLTGGTDEWLRDGSGASVFYAQQDDSTMGPICVLSTAGDAILLETADAVDPVVRGHWLFVAVGQDANPRLIDLRTRKMVYENDAATGALWPASR